MKIIFFDTETTGNMPDSRLCQLAIKEQGVGLPILNALYKPPMPIPVECSMIHHISNKMVAEKPAFKDAPEYREIKALFEDPNTICIAHNSAFDVSILANEDIHPANTICTFKVIRALDTEQKFAMHKLQYLRYALDMELDAPAHDAMGDVLVLEELFKYELRLGMQAWQCDDLAAYEKMIDITREPLAITHFNFGKYKGKTLAEVAETDKGYLQWLLAEKQKAPGGEEDWIATLEKFLK